MHWFLALSAFLFSIIYVQAVTYDQPEQIHLSFGEKLNDIVVTWSTIEYAGEPSVKYGEYKLNNTIRGESVIYHDPESKDVYQYICKVTLKDLKFNTTYAYKVGSPFQGWSSQFWFKTVPEGDNWVVRAAVYGDLGNENARSLPYLQDEATQGIYDFVLHVGDMAYNMSDDFGRVGDAFMKQIQPIAAYLPYMTCPGNHENYHNFSHYQSRFAMPTGGRSGMYYSWDAGSAHFISITTEYYYYLEYSNDSVRYQYDWLIDDLEKANSKENRAKRPWIILYGHRPMYCNNYYANDTENECYNELTKIGLLINSTTRIPVQPPLKYGLETLLKKYNVDLMFSGHEHSYERTWPLYSEEVYNGSLAQPYVNPKATIHITTGAAGNKEKTYNFTDKPEAWSAFRSTDYGYGRLHVYNKTHLHYEQVSVQDKKNVTVIDSIWVVKS